MIREYMADIKSMNISNQNDMNKYYIMYDPSTVNLMGKIGADNFTVMDIVEYLTGKTLETCDEGNYTEFLAFLEVDRAKGRNSSIESLIKKAINSKYEGHAVNIAKSKLSEQLKKRTKLFTERANSKDPGNSGLTPKQIAIKNAKEKIERKRSGE
mgnify:CR=1 FL=1